MRQKAKHGIWQAIIATVAASLVMLLAPLSAMAESSIVGADQAAAAWSGRHKAKVPVNSFDKTTSVAPAAKPHFLAFANDIIDFLKALIQRFNQGIIPAISSEKNIQFSLWSFPA